jgi:hypothetical protein
LKVFGEACLKTALMKMAAWDRSFEFLPPNRRTTFSAVVAGWQNMLMPQIEARIGDKKPEAA